MAGHHYSKMRRIKICDDICFDLLRLLAPAKVGLELATVSDRFDALVDTHFMSRKWALGKLRIDRPFKGAKEIVIVKINADGSEETLPIPQTPLPNYIIGFEAIYFGCCVDNNVIDFLRHICPLFKSDVFLALDISVVTSPFFATSVWPLFNLSGISKMLFEYSNVFQQFRRRTSPSILSDCANLRFINYDTDEHLHFSPNDSDGSSDDQVLSKWLHTPRSDGRPKVIKSSGDDHSLGGLKKTFQNATTSASFIILMLMLDPVRPFEMDSLWTRERMTLRRIERCGWRGWALIERSPIGKNVHQWDEWVREALDDGESASRKWKVIATCDNPTL